MSKFYEDIIRQPEQLISCLHYQAAEGKSSIDEALRIMTASKYIFISAIGASWNAGLAIQHSLNESGIQAILCDAAEFYHFTKIPPQSSVLFLSRSGKSIEIVNSIAKCKKAGANIISITNDPASPLANGSDICMHTHVGFDHAISVNTYSSIILTGQLLAKAVNSSFISASTIHSIEKAFLETGLQLADWNGVIEKMEWPWAHYYFLARAADLASAYAGRLLWEEAAKYPASALSTGAFRHGPQEIINNSVHIFMWLQHESTRDYDMQLVKDLRQSGVSVMTIGYDPEGLSNSTSMHIPKMPFDMDAVINTMPVQLAADRFASLRGRTVTASTIAISL